MANLSNSPLGFKRLLLVAGISGWDALIKKMTVDFAIQIVDINNNLHTDQAIEQNRIVTYQLDNSNKVDSNFNPVQSGGTGEYDYFDNLLKTNTSFYTIIGNLANKLNERGLFN